MTLVLEDYVSIGLAVVLVLLIIAIIVVLLAKNGYCGRTADISPTELHEKDRPQLISNFARSGNGLYYLTTGQTDKCTPRFEFKPGPEANPIIYLYNDIYHPPAKTPTAEEVKQASDIDSVEKDVFEERNINNHKSKKTSSKRRPPLPHRRTELCKGVKNAENAAIPDSGINVYTIYGHIK